MKDALIIYTPLQLNLLNSAKKAKEKQKTNEGGVVGWYYRE